MNIRINKTLSILGLVICVISILILLVRQFLPIASTVKGKGELLNGHGGAIVEYKLEQNGDQALPSEDSFVEIEQKYKPQWDDSVPVTNFFVDAVNFKTQNGDSYEILSGSAVGGMTELKRNSKAVWRKGLVFTTFEPIRRKLVTGNTFAFSYTHYPFNEGDVLYGVPESGVVINGGIDANKSYNLDSSFAPMVVPEHSGEIIFLGIKSNKSYLVMKEKTLELPYSVIVDPPCCSSAMFGVRTNERQMAFFAKRDSSWYYVIVDVQKLFEWYNK